MHTQANRFEFEIKGPTVVHTPTGAEFIPQVGGSVFCGRATLGRSCPAETSIGMRTYSM